MSIEPHLIGISKDMCYHHGKEMVSSELDTLQFTELHLLYTPVFKEKK
jgi:hypothetical protein